MDLGERLLRAFDTPTGMPRSRVNLKHGIPKVGILREVDGMMELVFELELVFSFALTICWANKGKGGFFDEPLEFQKKTQGWVAWCVFFLWCLQCDGKVKCSKYTQYFQLSPSYSL